jgi:thiol-disulfide isomerase/thioredoxin
MKELRGKVVLIDYWTYTCINCIRTLPYVKSWWTKYKDKGLVIVGVHTPEFEFEKNADNVEKAIKNFGITYPVMQDNNYDTWNAYNNDSWPAEYLIDKSGKIRFKHIGEGDYDGSEKHIQELLAVDMPIQNPTYTIDALSPETYLGRGRGDYSNIVTTGAFIQSEEFTHPKTNATLTYRFNAKDVYLVMRPTLANVTARVRVLLDGKLQKEITIDTDKLYTLIELPKAGAHTLKLEFLDDNVDLFAFTFG